MSIAQKLSLATKRKSVKYGIPFLILMVGGSFGLKEFTQLRYQFTRTKPVSPGELEKIGVNMKQPEEVTLEGEFEKVKKINIDNWENIRGPRPWEEEE